MAAKPKIAVWKFASCDGCQLALLNCEEELLEVAEQVEIAYFLEATRGIAKGPYDISLVEGSVTTAHDIKRIKEVRTISKYVITIGACATAGGVQALKNFASLDDYINAVYANPDYISSLESSTPISDHIDVDLELRGCPINKLQLLEVLVALLHNRRPNISAESVCQECKRKGNICVMVAHGTPCLGPVTHAGCGALCPSYHRGCYGCFGPQDSANPKAMSEELKALGMSKSEILRFYRTFNANAEEFSKESCRHE